MPDISILIKIVICFFLRLTFIPTIMREFFQKNKITVLNFHNVPPQKAEMQLRTLTSLYNIVSLKEAVMAIKNKKLSSLPKKPMVITYDDGYLGNYKLLDIFKKYQIYPTIFLVAGIVGTKRRFWFDHCKKNTQLLKTYENDKRLEELRDHGFEEKKEFEERQTLSKEEICQMKEFVDFQSHTVFHPILPKCSDKKARYEISEAKSILEKQFALSIYSICYPNGDYCQRDINLVKEAGYLCGVASDIGCNDENADIFKIKRIPIRDGSGKTELIVTATGLWWYIKFSIPKIFKIFTKGS